MKQIVRNREIPHEVANDDSNISTGGCDEMSIQQQIRSLQEEVYKFVILCLSEFQ